MLSPSPGSTFTSSSRDFSFGRGSATAYGLLVGSSQNRSTSYSSRSGLFASTTVNNIPTDGRTIYVSALLKGEQFMGFQTITPNRLSILRAVQRRLQLLVLRDGHFPTANSKLQTATVTPTPTPTSGDAHGHSDSYRSHQPRHLAPVQP